jgi:2-polyprenyl-3-methyl-5-hydroxy-6-metoxy-1,4-benzoquinol methylase
LKTTHTATYADEYFQYLQGRTALRKFLRNAYLRDIRKYCQGKTIDFGCGVGDLLLMLPSGSVGFEVNGQSNFIFRKKTTIPLPSCSLVTIRRLP